MLTVHSATTSTVSMLIYVLLSQTMSNNNNRELDKKIEDCRRRLSYCPSWSPKFLRAALVLHLSLALYNRFDSEQLGGIEYLDEAITYCRQGLDLCPRGYVRTTLRALITWGVLWAIAMLGLEGWRSWRS